MATGTQKNKQKPIYYKLDIDVVFQPKNNKAPALSPLE